MDSAPAEMPELFFWYAADRFARGGMKRTRLRRRTLLPYRRRSGGLSFC
jgi:hypothetical protein